ncbi:MAG: response regulator [Terriglobales bacterium]
MNEPAPNLRELSALARRLTTEYGVSRILAEGGGAESSLRRVLAVMGRELQWEYCVCWRLQTASPPAMRILASWQRHPERSQALEERSRQLELTPDRGFAGRAWRTAAPQWCEDVGNADGFLLAAEAQQAGLGPGVAYPISFRGQVLGLLEFLATRGATPDADSQPVLISLSEQIGQFLNHDAVECALRASEARYRALFDANIAGVHCSTLEGMTVAVNPAFVRMFGFGSMEQALACDANELYADRDDRAALIQQLRQQGVDANRQLRLRRHDGAEIWVLANTVLISAGEGLPEMNESTVIDITEAKELERRTRQSSKMEGIGRLAGGIAHDFNNLLTVINGYSDQLLGKLGELDPVRASVGKIRQAGHRAEALTRQLLSFSRRQPVEPTVLDLAATVGETAAMLERTLGAGVRIRRFVEPGLGHIRADAGQISQIVINLAINARDAMPEGGDLLIEMNNLEIGGGYLRSHIQARPGPCVRLTISDTGCGMDLTTRQHAFEPFFTTKPQGEGTGLGLATVYGLVMQNSGWIELYSEPGRGTAFKMYFPRVDAPVAAATLLPSTPAAGGGESALIVEDQAEVRALMQEVLREAGYRVVAAASGGDDAIARAPADLDLLVTDIVMPGLTGPELAARLGARHPRLRVLFVSGYTEQAVIHQSIMPEQREGWRYLQKPFSPEALLAAIRELLDRRAGCVTAG